jgi:peptidoglycan/xylan/chitin deacetylase (PgdA/CDA1 family)
MFKSNTIFRAGIENHMPDPLKIFQKTRNRLDLFGRDLRWQLGMDRSGIGQAKGARILVYHGVCKEHPFRFNSLFITQKVFEKQLLLYKKYFHIVSLDDFYEQRFSNEKFNICLSFDDGFFNNYEYVLPLLEKYEVPACFFITAIREAGYEILWNDVLSIAGRYGPDKFVLSGETFVKNRHRKYISASSGKSLNEVLRSNDFSPKAEMIEAFGSLSERANRDYWLQMSEDQIRKLSASKWATIGSHSYFHNDLAQISGSELKNDLERSKHYLQKITDREITALAFPYGSHSSEAIATAKASGYSRLLATEYVLPQHAGDPALKARFTINPFVSTINQLHANIRGHYS